ncbi:hypothetical protein [Paraburkholderia youngii]|uniref:hypothetical protein n=1 Tax=Paraburkholderia youngii TaxID=2782701 RepID=UPI003D21BBBF
MSVGTRFAANMCLSMFALLMGAVVRSGFDDIPMAVQVHPPLTTIRQPFQQMARAAVNTLWFA